MKEQMVKRRSKLRIRDLKKKSHMYKKEGRKKKETNREGIRRPKGKCKEGRWEGRKE